MAYPLKKNLSNNTNSQNIIINSLNDEILNDSFAESLYQLITGWVSSGTYNISLNNTQNKDSLSVQYTANTVSQNPYSVDGVLSDYITNTLNKQLTKGELIINPSNKIISFKPKETAPQKDPNQKTTSSATTTSNMFVKDKGIDDSKIDQIAADIAYKSGIDQFKDFNTSSGKTVTTESILQNNILKEDIKRMKKLMNL